jgi:hypothetical protein
VAVVDDQLVNGPPEGLDLVGVLQRLHWGMIVLPAAWYPPEVAADLLTQVAEHVEEFVRHGYDVVCLGSATGLAAPLGSLGVEMPDTITPARDAELAEFLLGRKVRKSGPPD